MKTITGESGIEFIVMSKDEYKNRQFSHYILILSLTSFGILVGYIIGMVI